MISFQVTKYLRENELEECLNCPSKIFNVDETSFKLNPKSGKVLAKRGARNVYNMVISAEKDAYTVLLGGNSHFSKEILSPYATCPIFIFYSKTHLLFISVNKFTDSTKFISIGWCF